MKSNPCNVCGGTELNLVDGYYYCVECGTQDVNVLETIVERTVLADGTLAFSSKRKVHKILKDKVKMSGEWYKWHAFNFILFGLTKELLAAGAQETVKGKIIWIWTKYILKYQVKEDEKIAKSAEDSNNEDLKEEVQTLKDDCIFDDENSEIKEDKKTRKKKSKDEFICFDVDVITQGVLIAILYLALNFDRSDIQLCDLYRFIFEGRISIQNCIKFVPKEIDTRAIPRWKSFTASAGLTCINNIRTLAMSLIKRLDLGLPVVPDLTKIINNYINELCLPLGFGDFVLSLTQLIPLNFLQGNLKSVAIPNYECVCMTYIVLGLKILFGLDSEYEVKLSEVVQNINEKENYLKSYKLGFPSEPTGRLFSFREWSSFIQFRKNIICQNYSPMAQTYNFATDDNVLMEHLYEIQPKKQLLRQEVTMNIINRIAHSEDFEVIPKKDFPATISPLTKYTEIILDHTQDPDLRLALCEDFTHYSMDYATKMMGFTDYDYEDDLITGVSSINKTINSSIFGKFKFTDTKGKNIVFVRNCENKNWLETKPPNVDHITIISSDSSEIKGNEYNCNSDSTLPETKEIDEKLSAEYTENKNKESKVESFEEQHEDLSIFDDDFKNCSHYSEIETHNMISNDDIKSEFDETKVECNDMNVDDEVNFEFHNPLKNIYVHYEDDSDNEYINPDKIDRSKLIKLLLDNVCQIYKIPIPKGKTSNSKKQPRKRNSNILRNDFREKKSKCQTADPVASINDLVSSYHEHLHKDILNQVSEQVKSFIKNNNENNCDATHNAAESIPNDIETIFEKCPDNDNAIPEITPDHLTTEIIDDNTIRDHDVEDNDSELVSNTQENEEDETEIVINKGDPEFDMETHDIEQLYVKVKDNIDIEYESEMNDSFLTNLLDKKIKEMTDLKKRTDISEIDKHKNKYKNKGKGKTHELESSEDSEDDLPLNILLNKNNVKRQNCDNHKFEPLIKSQLTNKCYNMWHRNYRDEIYSRYKCIQVDVFDLDLNDNFSPSFAFVIQECAALINCSCFTLYKYLKRLEIDFLKLQKTEPKDKCKIKTKKHSKKTRKK